MSTEIPIHKQFQQAIKKWTRNKNWLAQEMMLNVTTFSLMIKGHRPITDENRKKLNELLGTSIGENSEVDELYNNES